MAAKMIAFVCCFAVFNVVTSQVLNLPFPGQLVPGLVPNALLPNQLLAPQILPNQLVFNSPSVVPSLIPSLAPALPSGPNVIVDLPGYGLDAVYSTPVTVPATTTIIQDSTVANNLANALQLLVVSNLLSNTLPSFGCADVVSPVLPLSLAGLPNGYSYVY